LTHCRQNGDNRAWISYGQWRFLSRWQGCAASARPGAAWADAGDGQQAYPAAGRKLQARLLHRSTREVSLTDVGQAYLAPCMATVAQAQEAARVVAQAGDDLAGPLRIQAPSSFGSEWLADAVARFALLHPRWSRCCTWTMRCSIRSSMALT
jgi:hypothetical protein